MDCLPQNENTHLKSRRKPGRPKKVKHSHVRPSSRKPLGDICVSENGDMGDSNTISMDPSQVTYPVNPSPYQSVMDYCQYLKSIMTPELFEMVDGDLLSTLPPDIDIDGIELLVTQYLRTGDVEPHGTQDTELPPPCERPSRVKRRMTADLEIMESGFALLSTATPSPPVKTRRRSKRLLRSSLLLYGNQSDADNTPIQSTTDTSLATDPTMLDSDPTAENVELEEGLNTALNSEDVLSSDAKVTDELDASTTNLDMDVLNGTFTLDSTFTVDTEQQVPPEIVDLYHNRNYSHPFPKQYPTIYEETHTGEGHSSSYSTNSTNAEYRFYEFSDSSWYRVSADKQRERQRKARINGWRKMSKAADKRCSRLVDQAMSKLESLTIEHP